jgi:hypothetical protein
MNKHGRLQKFYLHYVQYIIYFLFRYAISNYIIIFMRLMTSSSTIFFKLYEMYLNIYL